MPRNIETGNIPLDSEHLAFSYTCFYTLADEPAQVHEIPPCDLSYHNDVYF